ncbi:hypothetical protein HPG69_013630, partial [Diceros bicornis minor]
AAPQRREARHVLCADGRRHGQDDASDRRRHQEGTAAIQTAILLHAEGKTSLHKNLKQKRREQREQRERRRAAKQEELLRQQQLQEEEEPKLQELELLQEAQWQTGRCCSRRRSGAAASTASCSRRSKTNCAGRSRPAETELKKEEAARQRQRIQELRRCSRGFRRPCNWRRNRSATWSGRSCDAGATAGDGAAQRAAQWKLRQASINVKPWDVRVNRLTHPVEPGEPHPLGIPGQQEPSPSSSEQQKSLNGGDEAPILASTPLEDKLHPAPEN